MIKKMDRNESVTIIKPLTNWNWIDFKALVEYRDLFFFLVWRDIKVMYAQTILGFSWALLQPVIQIVIFSVIFGKVAKINTDGIPYVLYAGVGIIPWNYMSQAMSQASQSLIQNQQMLGKIYFPRQFYPITPILSRLIDFGISLLILVILLFYYQVMPTFQMLLVPLFILMMIMISLGIGMWLSSLSIRFRDVKYALVFLLRMLMYTAPIVYSASSIPDKYRLLYSCNPIVGVIEGFRACLLGTTIPWQFIWPGICTAFILFFSGALYFQKTERIFVDVI
jgi:lipopolysaccharide transport system permease protein